MDSPKQDVIWLSVEGQRQIAALLLHPPAPGSALKKAFQRRHELLDKRPTDPDEPATFGE